MTQICAPAPARCIVAPARPRVVSPITVSPSAVYAVDANTMNVGTTGFGSFGLIGTEHEMTWSKRLTPGHLREDST